MTHTVGIARGTPLSASRPSGRGTGSITIESEGREIEVRLASGRDDFAQAFRLLAEKYQARGYDEPGSKLFRFTPYHVLPGTITVVARAGDRVIATLSMVPDTPFLGLPLESTFPEEIARLRGEGRRLAEVTSLADVGLSPRGFLPILLAMTRLVHQYHERQGGDAWVIAVNPRHGGFYRKVLGFTPIGDRRSHPAVLDAPAEAYLLDLDMLRSNAPRMFEKIVGDDLPEEALTPPPRPDDHVEFYASHSPADEGRRMLELARAVEDGGRSPRWRADAGGEAVPPPRFAGPSSRAASFGSDHSVA
jgi:N-acyl amino acid synthase FeeM